MKLDRRQLIEMLAVVPFTGALRAAIEKKPSPFTVAMWIYPKELPAGKLWTNTRITHAAVWDVALDDKEIAQLSKGYPAQSVRPDDLATYIPMTEAVREGETPGGWHHAYGVFK